MYRCKSVDDISCIKIEDPNSSNEPEMISSKYKKRRMDSTYYFKLEKENSNLKELYKYEVCF